MNVPKLRFKEFNDEWQSCKIGDFCKILMCKRIFANETSLDYEIPFYKIGTIGGIPDTYISKQLFEEYKSKYNYPKKGELLITCSGTVGKCTIFDGHDSYYQDSNIVWLDNPTLKVNNNFLYYLLSKVDWSKLNSTTIVRIYGDNLRQLEINFPIKNEQIKISKTLELLDKKIELQTKKIEDLKLFKLYTENNLLNSSDSVNWEEMKLNDILIEGNKKPVKNTNDFKKITIKLNLNGLELNESKREMSDKRPFYIREENEIIIGKQNYFNGSIAIVTKEFAGCICSNAIMSFKVKEEYDLNYIYLYLSQKRYMKEREFLANGTGQKELSEKEFLNFTIKIPKNSIVKNITNTIDKINKKINFENKKLNKLIELKKGLMQKMFV